MRTHKENGMRPYYKVRQNDKTAGMAEDFKASAPKSNVCKCKCVFKVEHYHAYHARLVAYEKSQVPRVNISKNYSSVVNDIM